jgi:hypothetical protein
MYTEVLVGIHVGTGQIRRPKIRWEDNIRRDLKEIALKDTEWIHLAQDRDW